MNARAYKKTRHGNNQRGVSLIELMVALTIGLVLVYGATELYVKSRATYEVNDSVARLQENARYALNAIEQDVRLANYWGLSPTQRIGSYGPTGSADQLLATPSSPLSTGALNDCGKNFAVDLSTNIQGDNNGYLPSAQLNGAGFLSSSSTALCNHQTVTATADTLTIRRAATCDETALNYPNNCPTQTLLICSSIANIPQLSTACGANDGFSTLTNDLLVHAYYVSPNSDQQNGSPSLRRMRLSGSAFQDEEVIAGVEDMQVQFGIDPTGCTGVVAQYVNPDSNLLASPTQIVTVRVWLLMRSETPEPGFVDGLTYSYGDRQGNTTTFNLNTAVAFGANLPYQPSASPDNSGTSVKRYRRLRVMRTFLARNIRLTCP